MRYTIGMILLCLLIGLTGCQRKPETYASQREKTADMQDVKIQQMKQTQTGPDTGIKTEKPESETTEPPATERPAPPATEPVPPVDPESMEYPMDVVLTGELNMRDGPGEEYQVIYSLDDGDALEVIGTVFSEAGEPWYRVVYNGERGYVDATALSYVSNRTLP